MKIYASLAIEKVDFGPIIFTNLNIDKNLEKIAQIGYAGTDIFVGDNELHEIELLRKKLDSLNLRAGMVAGIKLASQNVNLSDQDKKNRLRSIRLVENHLEKVAILGGGAPIGFIRGNIQPHDPYQSFCERLADSLHLLATKALSLNIPLYIEPINRYESNTFPTIEKVLHFTQAYELNMIGILADFFHMNIEESNIPYALTLGANHIMHIHCADSNRLVPGLGHFPYQTAIKCLKEMKYDPALAIEAFTESMDPYLAAEVGFNYLNSTPYLSNNS